MVYVLRAPKAGGSDYIITPLAGLTKVKHVNRTLHCTYLHRTCSPSREEELSPVMEGHDTLYSDMWLILSVNQ